MLGNAALVYNRKDGSTYTGWETLPSSFIYIENNGTDEEQVTSFTIYGGGYGHGAGMSQNAAEGHGAGRKKLRPDLKLLLSGL